VFAAALLALLGASGWGTRAATVLLGALVVRCNLKPSEARAAALTASMQRRRGPNVVGSYWPPSSVPCAVARSASTEPALAHCALSGMLLGTGGMGLHGSKVCMAPRRTAATCARPAAGGRHKLARAAAGAVRPEARAAGVGLCAPPVLAVRAAAGQAARALMFIVMLAGQDLLVS